MPIGALIPRQLKSKSLYPSLIYDENILVFLQKGEMYPIWRLRRFIVVIGSQVANVGREGGICFLYWQSHLPFDNLQYKWANKYKHKNNMDKRTETYGRVFAWWPLIQHHDHHPQHHHHHHHHPHRHHHHRRHPWLRVGRSVTNGGAECSLLPTSFA